MRIVAVSMVKNENDIIESFVRHHAPLVDAHYILDNGSSDATRTILERLRGEGLPVRLLRDVTGVYEQSRKTTELAKKAAAETDAEYILPLDADEFVLTSNRAELETHLAALDGRVGNLQWYDYICMPGDNPGEPDALRRICHRIEPAPERFKVAIPRAVALKPSVKVSWGQHSLEDGDQLVEAVRLDRPLLAHLPIRSGPQLVSKAVIGRLAIRASPDWDPKLGFHWDNIAASIKDPAAVTDDEVHQATLILSAPASGSTIVRSPVPVNYPALRYGDLMAVEPLRLLLAFTAHLLDDEAQQSSTGADNERLASGVLPQEWRKNWREAEAKVLEIQRQMNLLTLRHPIRFLVHVLARRVLDAYRRRRGSVPSGQAQTTARDQRP